MNRKKQIETLKNAYNMVLESIKEKYPNDYQRADFICSEHTTLDDMAHMILDLSKEESEEEQMVENMAYAQDPSDEELHENQDLKD